MEVKTLGVLGAGAMGGGIAQVAAQAGFQLVLADVDISFVERAVARMDSFWAKSVEKGKMTAPEKEAALSRIKKTTDLQDFGGADLVVEAIIEDLPAKQDAFRRLDEVLRPEAILASNTSSMSITLLGSATGRPDRVAGMHFFNPAPIMRLVEIIRGYATSDETVAMVRAAAEKMGKVAVEVRKDSPGFIVNRVMLAQFVEAIKLVEEGVATPQDVDLAIKNGLNYPMGPFELMDFTGVDIGYHVMNYFYEEFKDMRWNPPQALKAVVRAGRLGRKSGAGWFDYE